MKTIQLTTEEINALYAYLWSNPCSSGCVYPEMEHSNIDCDECKLTHANNSIIAKLDKEECR